jgi:hypothetical protein
VRPLLYRAVRPLLYRAVRPLLYVESTEHLPCRWMNDFKAASFDVILLYYGSNTSFACEECLEVVRLPGPKWRILYQFLNRQVAELAPTAHLPIGTLTGSLRPAAEGARNVMLGSCDHCACLMTNTWGAPKCWLGPAAALPTGQNSPGATRR